MKRLTHWFRNYPIIFSIACMIIFGSIADVWFCCKYDYRWLFDRENMIIWAILSGFIVYPGILTLMNVVTLFWIPKDAIMDTKWEISVKKIEIIGIILGVLYSGMFMLILDIEWIASWSDELLFYKKHPPIMWEAMPTVVVVSLIGVIGYVVLSIIPLKKMKQSTIVFLIGAMYCGIYECIMWSVQVMEVWPLCVFPINCIVIALKTIRYKSMQCNQVCKESDVAIKNAENWVVDAFFRMWVILGCVVVILMAVGQKPSYIIESWTETSEWKISIHEEPRNIY